MLKSLDLFSGVGGITHALRGLATPVMYCEKDPDCHVVLNKLMKQGRLPKAPIQADITTLSASQVPKIDMVCAGFPCFVEGTLVNTDVGYKPIETVTGEDLLLTHTGALKPVENLQRTLLPAGSDLYRLDVKHHPTPIRCTEEHPFYVRTCRVKNGETHFAAPEFLAAKHLTTSHVVGMPVDSRSVVHELTLTVNRRPTTLRLDDPRQWWVLGYFLGDGWTQDNKKPDGRLQYRICFVAGHKDEAVVVPRLREVLPQLHLTKADVTQGCTKYVACNKMWWTLLQDFGRYAHGKRIPDWVHAAPTHLVQAFVEGYMQADGCERLTPSGTTEWRMGTVSPEVALGVQRLLAKLGHTFGVRLQKKPRTSTIDVYEVSGRPVRLRPKCGAFIEDGYVWYNVTEVSVSTTPKAQWVYNFQVADDNSYCVCNVATHNCIGFSTSGLREGLDQAGSKLFLQVMRLAKAIRPPLMFFENVDAILGNDDIHKIVGQIRGLGYDMYWTVLPAYAVGAHQKRSRWFCLCVRRGVRDVTLRPTEKFSRFNWAAEPSTRMIPHSSPDQRRRIRMLGNSVVPDCVRAAFLSLFTGCVVPIPALLRNSSRGGPPIKLSPPASMGPLAKSRTKAFAAVVGTSSTWQRIPRPRGMAAPPSLNLVLDPKAFKSKVPISKQATSGFIRKPKAVTLWSTPRANNGASAMNILTVRGSHDLGSQLRFEKKTPATQRTGVTSPDWAENLMGFPRAWTAAA